MSSSSESHGTHDFNAVTPPINSVSDERLAGMLESARRLELSEWVSAWTELTAFRAARRAANTPVDGVDEEDLASDERWNEGVNYAIKQLCELLGIDWRTINWDAATETLDGDVRAVIGGVLVATYGDEWSSDAETTARIQACLTSPAAEPDYWAVWSATGTHIGTWPDKADAEKALQDYEWPIPKLKGSIKPLYTHPAPPASREVTDSGLAQRLNNAASIIEQWDAWEIGAANKPTVRLTVSASKLLREAAAALTLPERGM